MRRSVLRGRLTLVACTAVLLSSCSLMNLDDFGFTPCDPDNERTCDGANAHEHIDIETACELYACQSGRCVLGPRDADGDGAPEPTACKGVFADDELDCADKDERRAPGKPETCDGIDNDCDGLIDQGEFTPDAGPQAVAELGAGARVLGVAATQSQTFVAAGAGGDARGFVLIGDEKPTDAALRYRSVHGMPIDAEPQIGCPVDGASASEGCRFDEVAIAAYPGRLVYATVDRGADCPAGRIRLGISRADAAPFDVLLGKPQVSNFDDSHLEFGVAGTGCRTDSSGGGRTFARVASPAIAVAERSAGDDERVEALALWLVKTAESDDSTEPACGTRAAHDVAVLRVLVYAPQRDTWLAAARDGTPSTLKAQTIGSTAPVALAWNHPTHGGFFTAYAVAEGVLISFLPQATDVDADPALGRIETVIEATSADRVALALKPEAASAAGVQLRAVWSSGCDDSATLESAELAFDAERETFSMPSAMRIADIAPAGSAALLYTQQGFAVDDPRGGWTVLWTERDGDGARATAVRIGERSHQSQTHVTLAASDLIQPFLYSSDNANVRYGGVIDTTSLGLGPISCDSAIP